MNAPLFDRKGAHTVEQIGAPLFDNLGVLVLAGHFRWHGIPSGLLLLAAWYSNLDATIYVLLFESYLYLGETHVCHLLGSYLFA